MIDKSNEIFTALAECVRGFDKTCQVIGESVDTPSVFPTVTIEEISNVPKYLDSGSSPKYAFVTYRIQVFCNDAEGKRARARELFKVVDDCMYGLGFVHKTYTTTPTIYNSKIYSITSTFEGVIDTNGIIYRN